MDFSFRVVAINETKHWRELPLDCTQARGLYLVCEGEATHCCSLTPSSRADFIENEFLGVDVDSSPALMQWVEDNQFENGGEPSTYFEFIDFATTTRKHSQAISITIDPDDHDGDEEKMREAAWEEAAEYVRGNSQYVPE